MSEEIGGIGNTQYEKESIDDLVAKLSRRANGQPPSGYITHIRFPNFKNMATDARIEFQFPVTALVGPNGSGKTSVVHALFGAPMKHSVANFWFSTPLDPIVSRMENPPRYIYGHFHKQANKIVETRKARVGQDIDYWEPTKEVLEDGMEMGAPSNRALLGRSKDRWNPVVRKVVYLNFRSELSAFDKYFFFGTLKETAKIKSKQDRLRRWTALILDALKTNAKSIYTQRSNRNKLHDLFSLNLDELKAVRYILGKDYESARCIDHSTFNGQRGLSVLFRNKQGLQYSEAFAGSGEMSVVALISALYKAEKESLILLDEPEVSLHPGAQARLLEVVLSQVCKNSHQVVFSTHSPAMVRILPKDAICLFVENADGKFEVQSGVYPATAFSHIGEPVAQKLNIYVEDRLARELVKLVLRKYFHADLELFNISFFPGGKSVYFTSRIPTLMDRSESIFFLLDGDAAPDNGFPDPMTIPESENPKLKTLVEKCTNSGRIQFGFDGGKDSSEKEKRYAIQRRYLKFLHDKVRFLPLQTPEQIILHSLGLEYNCFKITDKDQLKKVLSDRLLSTESRERVEEGAISLLAQKMSASDDLPLLVEIRDTLVGIRQEAGI